MVLRFQKGIHYDGSPDPKVDMFEVLIPIDAPMLIAISPVMASEGTPTFDHFEELSIDQNHGIIIHPRACHYM